MSQNRPQTTPQSDISKSWLRRFWLIIAATLVVASSSIFFVVQQTGGQKKHIYVPLTVQTTTINGRVLAGKFSLKIKRSQESEMRGWEQKLKYVAAAELSDLYDQGMTNDLNGVRTTLLAAFNETLPRRLQIRDLLVQEFVRGWM